MATFIRKIRVNSLLFRTKQTVRPTLLYDHYLQFVGENLEIKQMIVAGRSAKMKSKILKT